jgi:phosphoglycolate phosphatase-like HAD superfamily hydrolase
MNDSKTQDGSSAYFIGVDSDGTVFDTMEIKHKRVFQPLAVEMWGLQSVESEYNEIAEFINLYSVHRGLNRFQSLIMAFERIAEKSEAAARALDGMAALREFVLSGCPLSVASMRDYNAEKKHPFLDQVLAWSQRSDDLYTEIMEKEGNPPYPRVRETLERAKEKADIMVISSSSKDTLNSDWGDNDLLGLTTRVMGQETGNKKAQIKATLSPAHSPDRSLMLGDAPGDLEAARANQILFFPILPGAEAASWERLESEALDRFFAGTYAGAYEEELLAEFNTVLQPDAPWPGTSES